MNLEGIFLFLKGLLQLTTREVNASPDSFDLALPDTMTMMMAWIFVSYCLKEKYAPCNPYFNANLLQWSI